MEEPQLRDMCVNDILSLPFSAKQESIKFSIQDLYCETVWMHSTVKSAFYVCVNLDPYVDRHTVLQKLFTEIHSIEYSNRLNQIKKKYKDAKVPNIKQPFWKLYRSLSEPEKKTESIDLKYDPLDVN